MSRPTCMEAFTEGELAALAELAIEIESIANETPARLPKADEFVQTAAAARLRKAARLALRGFSGVSTVAAKYDE